MEHCGINFPFASRAASEKAFMDSANLGLADSLRTHRDEHRSIPTDSGFSHFCSRRCAPWVEDDSPVKTGSAV